MIHIILCTYNGANYIKQQLDSILAQRYSDWTLHVYDDGSCDGTLDIIKSYSPRLGAKMRLHKGQMMGDAKSNFIGGIMDAARIMRQGDYMMLCDQDDVWLLDKIQVTLDGMNKLEWLAYEDGMEKETTPLLICTDSTLIDENENVICPSFMEDMGFDTSRLEFSHFLMENKVQGSTCMFNKSLADKITFIPEHMDMHDWWLALIASAMGQVGYINQATMLYRQHSDAVTSDKMGFWKDLRWKLCNLSKQKYIVYDKIPQAQELLAHYQLSDEAIRTAEAFIALSSAGWFARRKYIMDYNLWKSGLIKNIGLLILI